MLSNTKCSNGFCEFDSHTTTIIKIMFKIKENDIFKKNMSKSELYQVWKKMKWEKEMDKFLNKIITKNGITKY